ncbi:helix-turn-helix domain-containing protein [Hymenobacter sp. HSC-4F20]|uniref:helix-turn-helix domain-containing protein n=1 Tax=Hymenobacter sp. HSC-4F20 TaxID=2864135 RepID=UPI001C72F796|nr:helix-turn-helix domain-containing protein [Hymenobacter sp. HSC-4F20]MBX0290096.1 helix-turn-helix domain-containing protein [Hymenobacter sp. HSC-4F20]
MQTPSFTISNDQEHAAAVEQLIQWNQAPDVADRLAEIHALGEAVEAYEESQGWVPEPPQTVRGILEVEMFKRRIRQRQLAELLGVTETRLSEVMNGKREMNIDFARKLHTKLQIPGDVILSLAA